MRVGDVVAGRFHLEALAGSGGMGSVYRARDRLSGRTVAVKSVLAEPQILERFQREAAVLAELSHPAIVEHVAHGDAGAGEPFLAMEWLEGEDLEARLLRGRLAPAEVITVGRIAAQALAAAHARGIVHRDIKPANLFLAGGDVGAVKLVDFGIARLLHHDAKKTHAGMILGTPAYMSPEQARGDVELDARSDVFSLGAVLYECLSGAPPFEAEHVMGILAKLLLADPPRLRELGVEVVPALDELILQMLAKDPRRRPQGAVAVAQALGELDDAVPTLRAPPAEASALTRGEQRLLSVLFVGAPPRGEDAGRARAALEDVVRAHGGGVELFSDGSAVVLLSGAGAATDQAARAAEHGLAVRAALPFATVVLATGRGVVVPRTSLSLQLGASPHNSPPVIGQVIDRAVVRMRAELAAGGTPSEALAVDEVTAGLLDARFELGGDAGGLYVTRREESRAPGRTLLGLATPFVGRGLEMTQLFAALDACAAEPAARVVLVTGAAGAGKSRLAAELARLAPERGFEVWIGRGDLVKNHGPFGLVGRALAALAQIFDGEPIAVRRRKLRARIGRHLPRERADGVADFLGEISGTPFPDLGKRELQSARKNPILLADLVRRAFEEWLAAECEARPVLLILEDLQWGDVPSAMLIDNALRNLAHQRLAVVGLARPDLDEHHPRLFHQRRVERIALGELPAEASRALARAVLGPSAGPTLLDALAVRSGGNAFYLEELLRAVRAGHGIASLPETVIAMVHARLDAVSPEGRRVLRAASVFGDVFPRNGVVELLGGAASAPEVELCLADLVARELLLPAAAGKYEHGARYAFRSALVREAAYAMLVDADRERGHRRAAEWLVETGEQQAVVIAEHFERGAAPERAIEPYCRAARQALAGNDFRGAIAHVRRAAHSGATGKTLGEVLFIEADASGWLGEIAECSRVAHEAMGLLERGSAPWVRVAGLAAVSESRLGHADAFQALVRALVAHIPEAPPPSADAELLAAQIVSLSRCSVALFHAGHRDAGTHVLAHIQARVAAGLLDDQPFLLAFAHRARGIRAQSHGDLFTAHAAIEASAACFERAGALRDACVDRSNAGFFLSELGRNADAEAALLDALVIAGQLGLANVAANTRQNLSLVLSRRAAFADAVTMATLAMDTYRAQGARRMLAVGHIYLARICLAASAPRDAERHARAAVELTTEVAPFRAYALGALAAVMLAQARTDEAAFTAEYAMNELAAIGAEEGEAFLRLVAAEVLLAAGHTSEAAEVLTDARVRLLRRADAIHDPAFRETFLTMIPEHARTLELSGVR